MLCWIVELEKIDIMCEISMLALMMAMSQRGRLNQFCHIFAYLKGKHNTEMVFDPPYPEINEDMLPKYDWSHTLYSNVKELLPNNAPKAKGL